MDDRIGGARVAWTVLLAVLGVELAVVSVLYNNAFVFECRAVAPGAFCGLLSAAVLRAIAVVGALALLAVAQPSLGAALTAARRPRPEARWMGAQLAGFALVMAPWFFLRDGAPTGVFVAAVVCWLAGAALAGAGAAAAFFRPAGLAGVIRAAGPGAALALVVAALSPEIAALAQHAWRWAPITEATFWSSAFVLGALGQEVYSAPETVELGVRGFHVLVGKECSGVEGIVLISSFSLFYLYLFRDRLRFPHAFALLPVAIAASWTLNVVRIATLIMIGAHVSPDLAVNGFHSHAGWLMFTILAMAILLAAHRTPWLRAAAPRATARRAAPPPLAEDWNAARLAPFVVFMASALLASTFLSLPALAYPLRFVATAAALYAFRRLYLALEWRLDPVAAAAGLAVGALWIATAPAPDADARALQDALAALPVWAFAIWAATRIAGTALLVPLVEELVFRDYLLRRLNPGGAWGLVFAVAASTALFALLHGRWVEAALAGLVFAALALRRGRLADAVVSHAAANGLIAAWAVAQGDWSVI